MSAPEAPVATEQVAQGVPDGQAAADVEQDEAAPGPPPPRFMCEVCTAEAAKYRCPGCERRTCSLGCSRKHKEDTGCSGKRDRLKYVSLDEFDDRTLLSDLQLLEEVQRVDDVAKRCRPPFPKFQLPPYLSTLLYQANRRRIDLRLMNPGMHRRRANTTRYDRQSQKFAWRVEWQFVACAEAQKEEGPGADTGAGVSGTPAAAAEAAAGAEQETRGMEGVGEGEKAGAQGGGCEASAGGGSMPGAEVPEGQQAGPGPGTNVGLVASDQLPSSAAADGAAASGRVVGPPGEEVAGAAVEGGAWAAADGHEEQEGGVEAGACPVVYGDGTIGLKGIGEHGEAAAEAHEGEDEEESEEEGEEEEEEEEGEEEEGIDVHQDPASTPVGASGGAAPPPCPPPSGARPGPAPTPAPVPLMDLKLVDERVAEEAALRDVLAAHLQYKPGAAARQFVLRRYADAGVQGVSVFLKKEDQPANQPCYYEVDLARPLGSQLAGKVVIEFPVFTVCLKAQAALFPGPNQYHHAHQGHHQGGMAGPGRGEGFHGGRRGGGGGGYGGRGDGGYQHREGGFRGRGGRGYRGRGDGGEGFGRGGRGFGRGRGEGRGGGRGGGPRGRGRGFSAWGGRGGGGGRASWGDGGGEGRGYRGRGRGWQGADAGGRGGEGEGPAKRARVAEGSQGPGAGAAPSAP